MGPLACFSITAAVDGGGGVCGGGGGVGGCTRSRRASRVSSLMAFDMPVLRPPAGVSQWVAGPTTPVVWRFTAPEVKGLLDRTS